MGRNASSYSLARISLCGLKCFVCAMSKVLQSLDRSICLQFFASRHGLCKGRQFFNHIASVSKFSHRVSKQVRILFVSNLPSSSCVCYCCPKGVSTDAGGACFLPAMPVSMDATVKNDHTVCLLIISQTHDLFSVLSSRYRQLCGSRAVVIVANGCPWSPYCLARVSMDASVALASQTLFPYLRHHAIVGPL